MRLGWPGVELWPTIPGNSKYMEERVVKLKPTISLGNLLEKLVAKTSWKIIVATGWPMGVEL
jgi:hypothetical protein